MLNLIHGSGGEDGLVQSYLDRLSIKYVGSNSKSSKLSFNKVHTKEIWLRNKLKTPNTGMIPVSVPHWPRGRAGFFLDLQRAETQFCNTFLSNWECYDCCVVSICDYGLLGGTPMIHY